MECHLFWYLQKPYMLIVDMLGVIMLGVVILSVTAPIL